MSILAILAGLGLFVGLAFLVAPITSLTAGFFLDNIALLVEREINPSGPLGRPIAVGASALYALRFALLSILVNIIALLLLLAPGVNIFAFLVANGYLLGREYFELAAMRFRPPAEAKLMRKDNAATVFTAGALIAAFVSIPIVNLATPLFGMALMVHMHKRLSGPRLELDAPRRRSMPT